MFGIYHCFVAVVVLLVEKSSKHCVLFSFLLFCPIRKKAQDYLAHFPPPFSPPYISFLLSI